MAQWQDQINEIKRNVAIGDVVNYLGIESRRSGSHTFIRCPLPDHDDQHPTNCYFSPGDNACYCTVCRKQIGAIDMIMAVRNCGFADAADLLRDISHAPSYEKDEIPQKEQPFYLTNEEQAFLGIQFRRKVAVPVMETVRKTSSGSLKSGYLFAPGENYLVKKIRSDNLNFSDFMSEREFMDYVLKETDKKEKYLKGVEKQMISLGLHPDFSEENLLLSSIRGRIQGRRKIWKRGKVKVA